MGREFAGVEVQKWEKEMAISSAPRWYRCVAPLLGLTVLLFWIVPPAMADVYGTILGTVTDPSGAIVLGAKVVLRNSGTGLMRETVTDANGSYQFVAVPIGEDYAVEVEVSGFEKAVESGIKLLVNQKYTADFRLAVGSLSQTVSVTGGAAQVETTSTQLGDVIEDKKLTSMPLNGRSYIDLLGLQVGVVPITSGTANTNYFTGSPNTGNVSVNGQREASNSFLVNGGDVEHSFENGASVVPTLDSIQEFRLLTNSYDAEYGRFSGGIVNVVTKSGTNEFHGDVYDFLRNEKLDSRNFFDLNQESILTGKEIPGSALASLKRNQFGGTVGGPIRKNRLFFFADYQGTRQVNGASTGNRSVPSLLERGGDFSDVGITGYAPLTGIVRGDNLPSHFAQTLSSRLGYTVMPGEPYWVEGCSTLADAQAGTCVFPGQAIPQAAWDPVAKGTEDFLVSPTLTVDGRPYYSSSAYKDTLRDDKFGVRGDLSGTRTGNWSVYYNFDDTHQLNPLGGGMPGFGASTIARAQQVNLSNTLSPSPAEVNEARANFTRTAILGGVASGAGIGDISKYGWQTTGLGIIPPSDTTPGLPGIFFNQLGVGFRTAHPSVTNENSWQFLDNFSMIHGRHTIKVGADYRWFRAATRFTGSTGWFTFGGSETGNDFADYLIGAPDSFIQTAFQAEDPRSKYFGAYAQDSFKIRPNLTVNYGLRWEFSQPWSDPQGRVAAFVPGLQSKVFSDSPTGYVFPGDPGIPSSLSPTRYNNFSPRLGLAYSPGFSDGIAGKIFGGPGRSSIRASFGIFHTIYEEATFLWETGSPPYTATYFSPTLVYLEEPYKARATGADPGQRFPWVPPPKFSDYSFSPFLPLAYLTLVSPDIVLPYAEHFNFSLQRQIGSTTTLTVAYVGTVGRHLVTWMEANPGSAARCLQIAALYTAAGQPGGGCGPYGEDTIYTVGGQTFDGTRPYSVTSGHHVDQGLLDFGSSIEWGKTMGNSSYNSLQVTLEKKVGALRFLGAYTYGKSLDNASSSLEPINPFNFRLSRALSAFDVTHNFVASYVYDLPLRKLTKSQSGALTKLLGGWSVTGITRFMTGLPVTISQSGDRSLVGTAGGADGVDAPDWNGQPLGFSNPRSAPDHQWFSSSQFSSPVLGTVGTASRRFFHGPGLNNWDLGLLKTTRLTERTSLEFRAEFFNTFNHVQWYSPAGDFASSNFGQVTGARAPRIGQMALKLNF